MAKSQTALSLITSQSLAPGGTVRAVIDIAGVDMGVVTMRIANGATAPAGQVVCRILHAHKQVPAPSAGAEGTGPLDWKEIWKYGGGITASQVSPAKFDILPSHAHLEIEFVHTGVSGANVTIEAHASTTTYS